jgi:hypothetical protein
MDQRLATALCVGCGFFGGAMLFAFAMAFSNLNIAARAAQITKERKKGFLWWFFLSGLFADWHIWKETKGIRWLVPVGIALCAISYFIHRFCLAGV